MSDERVWLRFPETGGHFHCPADAAPHWTARGWEPCEAPPEVNLATAHWPAQPAPAPAAPAAKKSKPVTPASAENEEKIDG